MTPSRDVGRAAYQPDAVSVVIPCHNYGRFLSEALESAICQTLSPTEVVIIDDGSSDETSEVVKAIVSRGLSGVRALRRTPARGAVSTFNEGVRLTNGEYVVILSADDRMSPTYLEDLAEAMRTTGAGFAYPETRLFGARSAVWPAALFDVRRLSRDNYVNGSAMFRRILFDVVGGFDRQFDTIGKEDWAFWLVAVSKGWSGIGVSSCYLEYRQHDRRTRNFAGAASLMRTRYRLWQLVPTIVRPRDALGGLLTDLRRLRWKTP